MTIREMIEDVYNTIRSYVHNITDSNDYAFTYTSGLLDIYIRQLDTSILIQSSNSRTIGYGIVLSRDDGIILARIVHGHDDHFDFTYYIPTYMDSLPSLSTIEITFNGSQRDLLATTTLINVLETFSRLIHIV